MEIKFGPFGVTVDASSNCNPPSPMTSSSYSLFPNQPLLNVGTLTSVRQSNDAMVGGAYNINIEALVAREIEKKKIKEMLLTYGNLEHRRELEMEAIKELILEKGLAAVRQMVGISLTNAPLLSLQPDLSCLASNLVGGATNARLSLANCLEGGADQMIPLANHDLIDGKLSLGNSSNKNTSETLPFQRQPGVTTEVPCKPVIDLRKAVPLPQTATSDALAGSKRKYEPSVLESDEVAPVVSSKRTQRWWNCGLCHVTLTSEQNLTIHLKGRKHKAKEKTIQRAATTTTTTSVTNVPNKVEPTIEASDASSELAAVLSGTKSAIISNIVCGNEVAEKVEALSPKYQSNIGFGFGLEEKLVTEEFKKIDTNFKFWCKMCEEGTKDEASMAAHRAGGKHMSLLKENGGGIITVNTMPGNIQNIDLSRNETAIEEKEDLLSNVDGEKGKDEEK